MDDTLALLLFYAVLVAITAVVSLVALAAAMLPLLGGIFLLVFNIGIGREILTYEWDGAERLLWLVIAFFFFPFGAIVYIALRRQQREIQIAALRTAHDPRISHIPIYKSKK